MRSVKLEIYSDIFNDLNFADKEKNSPLHLCVMSGNEAATLILLKRQIDIEAKNNKGETPFIICCKK